MIVRNAKRGCGKRKKGGVYGEIERQPGGRPLESYLLDPIIPIDIARLKLSHRQPVLRKLHPDDDHHTIIDIWGANNYPNLADPLEETRALGMSRRMEFSREEYKLLIPNNPYMMVLPRAFILDADTLAHHFDERMNMQPAGYTWQYCPKENLDHHIAADPKNCAGIIWNRVDIGTEPLDPENPQDRYIKRTIGSVTYQAARSPEIVMDADPAFFTYGAVAIFRLNQLALVKGGDADKKKSKLEDLEIPVLLTDE